NQEETTITYWQRSYSWLNISVDKVGASGTRPRNSNGTRDCTITNVGNKYFVPQKNFSYK
ncbi:hypothetical protein KKB18_13660, partial [bacterium]|nr:hypothetical protein [bacterium]